MEWSGRRGSKLTWKTVTVAHKKLLKCLRSHSQRGCLLIISGQVHSLSPNSSSINLQNLPPNRYMPSMLQLFVIYRICIYGIVGLFLSCWIYFCCIFIIIRKIGKFCFVCNNYKMFMSSKEQNITHKKNHKSSFLMLQVILILFSDFYLIASNNHHENYRYGWICQEKYYYVNQKTITYGIN